LRNVETNSIPVSGNASVGLPLLGVSNVDRHASAWLSARLARGQKDRFCEVVSVSPAMAEALLACNSRNRYMTQSMVLRYADMMAAGLWRLTTEGIAIGNDSVLINGQHRLRAIVTAGVTVQMTVWFGCKPDEFEVADQGKKRTAAQVLSIKDVPNPAVAAALAAILTLQRNFDNGGNGLNPAFRASTQEIVAYSEQMDPERRNAACAFGVSIQKLTNPTAAALAYWHIAENSQRFGRFSEFHENLLSGENLTGPKLQLREWLKEGPYAKRNAEYITIKKGAAFVLAWNAWADKKKKASTLEWARIFVMPEVLS